jgi:hypothetical protein
MSSIPDYFPDQFSTNWQDKLQQMESRLQAAVDRSDFTGERKKFNLINAFEASEITTRLDETPVTQLAGTEYWLYQNACQIPTWFDKYDQHFLGQIVLPTSDTVRGHAMELNRKIDDAIISAFFGTRYIGAAGTTTDSFPAGQDVAVDYVESGTAANSGLTIAKLRKAARLLNEDEVPQTDRFIAITASELDNLLRTTETTNADFNTVRALVNGQIDTFMGFKFIHCERLPINSGTDITSVPVWHKSGIKLALGERGTSMNVIPQRNDALLIRSHLMRGAVRTENEKVVRIYCDRSPA